MRVSYTGSFFLIAALFASLHAEDGKKAEDPQVVFRTETRLVVLHVTVTNPDGRVVRGLPRGAFEVYESGVLQKLQSFRPEDVPISLGLVIDNSASMGPKRAQVASAALALVDASNPDDEVFVVNFSDTPSLDCDFTSDRAAMKRGLGRQDAHGNTAMRDAVRVAIERLRARNTKEKKAILVVTDGADNMSQSTLDEVVRAAQQSEVLVYAIGLLNEESPREARRAKHGLDALAQVTGGQTYYPADLAEIARLGPQIANELRSQYTLTYIPQDQAPDGSFRQVRVLVNATGVEVRTRSGYYATR